MTIFPASACIQCCSCVCLDKIALKVTEVASHSTTVILTQCDTTVERVSTQARYTESRTLRSCISKLARGGGRCRSHAAQVAGERSLPTRHNAGAFAALPNRSMKWILCAHFMTADPQVHPTLATDILSRSDVA